MDIEERLIKIAKEGHPKYITIDKQKFYVSRKAIDRINSAAFGDGISELRFNPQNTIREGGFLPFLIPIFTALGIRQNTQNLFLFNTSQVNLNHIYREFATFMDKTQFYSICNRIWGKSDFPYVFISKEGKITENVFIPC